MKYLLFLFVTNKLIGDISSIMVVHVIKIQDFCSLQEELNLPTLKYGVLHTCRAETELFVQLGRRQRFFLS